MFWLKSCFVTQTLESSTVSEKEFISKSGTCKTFKPSSDKKKLIHIARTASTYMKYTIKKDHRPYLQVGTVESRSSILISSPLIAQIRILKYNIFSS